MLFIPLGKAGGRCPTGQGTANPGFPLSHPSLTPWTHRLVPSSSRVLVLSVPLGTHSPPPGGMASKAIYS